MLTGFSSRKRRGDRETMRLGLGQVLFALAQKISNYVPTVLIQRNLGRDWSHYLKQKAQPQESVWLHGAVYFLMQRSGQC